MTCPAHFEFASVLLMICCVTVLQWQQQQNAIWSLAGDAGSPAIRAAAGGSSNFRWWAAGRLSNKQPALLLHFLHSR
jgi:hypothetical protein